MIDVRLATESIGRMALLKFFPADPAARAELVKLACEMASTNEQIDWLVQRCRNRWNQWEGPLEFRALLCSKYKPADGIEAYSSLPQHADGIPSEAEDNNAIAGATQRQIAAPNPREAAESLTAAKSIQDFIREAARSKNMNRKGPAPKPPEIPVSGNFKPITKADIDAEIERLRDQRGREEL